jgi:hypothetical protein
VCPTDRPEYRAAFAIVADGVDRAPAVRQMKEESKSEKKRGKKDNAPRDRRVADHAEPNLLVPVRKAINAPLLEDDLCKPAIKRERANRDDQ